MSDDTIGYIAVSVVGLASAGIGGWLRNETLWLRRHGTRVPGRIVESRRPYRVGVTSADSRSERLNFAPLFEFHTLDGASVRGTHKAKPHFQTWRSGQEVTIVYDPEHPERAQILEAKSQYRYGVLFLVLGLASSAMGLLAAIATAV